MKKQPPDTPAAQTPAQALRNLNLLIEHRASGWDRLAVRDIIAVVYGDTETFVQRHIQALEQMQQAAMTVTAPEPPASRQNPFRYNAAE
jgi:hypothetical protein